MGPSSYLRSARRGLSLPDCYSRPPAIEQEGGVPKQYGEERRKADGGERGRDIGERGSERGEKC